MKIYVAAKWEEKEEVRHLYLFLRRLGHEITHDWTVADADGLEGDALRQRLSECAAEDLGGVLRADALVLLPHERGAGLWVEFGAALALGLPVIVCAADVAPDTRCVFLNLPVCQWVTDDCELEAALRTLASRQTTEAVA